MQASKTVPTQQQNNNRFTLKSFYAFLEPMNIYEVFESLPSLTNTFIELTKGKFEKNFKKLIGIIGKTTKDKKDSWTTERDINKNNEARLIQFILYAFKDEILAIKKFDTLLFLLRQFTHHTEQNFNLVDTMKPCVRNIDQLNATLKYMPEIVNVNGPVSSKRILLERYETYWAQLANTAAKSPITRLPILSRLHRFFKIDTQPTPSAPPLEEADLKKLYESPPPSRY